MADQKSPQTFDKLKKKRRESVGDALYDDLKDYISTCPPHHALASEQEFSEQYDISRVTVRRMMQRLVDENMIYKVRGKGIFVADRLEGSQKSRTIVYSQGCSKMTHPFFAEKLRGILEKAEQEKINVQICRHHRQASTNENVGLMQALENPDLVGIIVPYISAYEYRKIKKVNAKAKVVVTVSTGLNQPSDIITLTMDDYAMGQLAAHYLLSQGVKTACFIGQEPQKYHGALQMFDEAGDSSVKLTMERVEYEGPVKKLAGTLLKNKPDGIIVSDDFTCRHLLDELKAQSGKEPEDLFLIVTQYNRNSNMFTENIAKIEFSGYEQGVKCVAAIVALQDNPELANCDIKIRPKLIPPTTNDS